LVFITQPFGGLTTLGISLIEWSVDQPVARSLPSTGFV
jgi:hypothetical protein